MPYQQGAALEQIPYQQGEVLEQVPFSMIDSTLLTTWNVLHTSFHIIRLDPSYNSSNSSNNPIATVMYNTS